MKQATLQAAHKDQKDKAGQPYFGHLQRVMNGVDGDDTKTVAILHDILEDTPITREYLLEHGFSEQIVESIEGVTKLPDEDGSDEGYMRFVERASQNPLSKQVKIADLKDNLDLTRISQPTDKDCQRIEKYKRALAMLED